MNGLTSLRATIEALDRRLLETLKERMDVVEGIAAAKLETAAPFRDRPREEAVLQRVRHLAIELGLDPHEIERLYRLVMEMSISHQQAWVLRQDTVPLRVGYQGVEGSFSHLSAQRKYAARPGGVLLTGYESFRQAADALREGDEDIALLPIENSTAGSINETYDLLAEGGLVINAEVVSAIEHCLVGLPGATVEGLRDVFSHPQALRQCDSFLRRHPHLAAREAFDTAGAARQVAERRDPTAAAIASAETAAIFGLVVIERGIQSERENYTRFVELGLEAIPCPSEASCKTSLLLATGHHPGALAQAIAALGARGVNLTKLESRPRPRKPFQYRFYLDLEGHAAEPRIAGAIADLRAMTEELRVLGTYPKAG